MEGLKLGLSTTATGMLVVFAGLVILIACISVMTSITGRKKKTPAPAPGQNIPFPVPVPVQQEAPQEDDLSVAAAITAAIAAIWQDEKNESGFVVRRIRRTQNSTARARAARDEQMFSRL